MSNLNLIINAIVVALMAVYVIINERRFQETHDRTVQNTDVKENLTTEIRRISEELKEVQNTDVKENLTTEIRRISEELKEVQYIDNVAKKLAVFLTDEIRRVSSESVEERGLFFVEFLNSWFAVTDESHENVYTTNKNESTVTAEIRRISEKVKNIENVVEKLKVSMTAEIPCICEERILVAEKEQRRTDDRALSMCIGIADKFTHIKSVRRDCTANSKVICENICKNQSLKCFNALHLYQRSETDTSPMAFLYGKQGGCVHPGCGPNYCCCLS